MLNLKKNKQMAKELPYFKFEPNAWENGNIQMLSREDKGLFIDICSMYWSRLSDLPEKLVIQKLCFGNAVALIPLYEENIIELIDGNIYVKFLSIQLQEFENTSNQNSENAKERWRKHREQKEISERNATVLIPQSETNAIREEKSKVNNINKDIFIEIKNFKSYHSNFSGNKKYLLIAYRFWELWKKDNPQNLTIKKAKVEAWVNTIRLIVEVDDQNIERLICVLKYFEKCQEENIEYDNFWFKTIKSIGGLRDTNKQGVYRLDSIMEVVNTKIVKDSAFNRLVTDSIDNFKNYNHERN